MLDFLKTLFRARPAEPPGGAAPLPDSAARGRAESLWRSIEHFDQLVAGVRDYAVFLLDRQGHVVTWNAGAEDIKGYTAEEIIGEHFSRFYPEEAVSSGWPAHELREAAETGRIEDEGWRVRKDGTLFWANVVITALRDKSGEVRGFLKITRDLTNRKQAEEQLRLSEERFRLMVEGVKDYAIFMLDPAGRVTTWNAGAERLKGYTADDIIGQHFSRFYPREAVERGWPEEELRLAIADGRIEDEGWRVRQDGTLFWANVVITALRDQTGTLRGFAKVTRDLTERRRAEESTRRLLQEEAARKAAEGAAHEIERQREQLHVTLASIGDAVIVTDDRGAVTFLNPVAASLTGWEPQEATGQPLERVFPIINERTRQPVENPVRRVFRERAVVELANHTALVRKDGRVIPIEDSAAPIRGRGEEVGGVVLVFRDVTEARRATEARLALAAIVESSDDAIIGHSLDCRITSWNKGAERLYGYAAAEIVGQPLAALVPPDHPDELPAILERIRRGESIDHFETERVRKDGRRVDVSLTISPVRNAEGEVVGASKIARDITERKRVEAALRRSERELSDFFENASVGLHWVGPDGTILRANRAELDLLGYTAEEYVGHNIAEFHADEPVICDILRRLTAGEQLRNYEARMRCKDGSVKNVLIDSSVLREDGRFVHTRCFTRDITAHKRAEEALLASEGSFRQLADAMPQIVWTAGPDGVIDYSNRRWYEISGSAVGVGNEGWSAVVHPEDMPSAAARWAESLRTGTAFELELRLLDRRTGGYRWHLMRTVPGRREGGAVVRWYGTATDIDGQKRAGDATRFLAEASAALASLVDTESTLQKVANLAVPYFADWSAVDVAGEDGALRRLAVAHREPQKVRLAQELLDRYPPEPDAPGGISYVFRTGRPEIIEEVTDDMLVKGARDEDHLRLIRGLGLRSYICVPLVVSGKPFGVLTFATAESGRTYARADLSLAEDLAHRAAVAIENANLYRALRDEDRRKSEFLALLAHELRNPLAPLRNGLQVLRLAGHDPGEAVPALTMMERQLHHLVRLVDDLLDVSRISRGKLQLRKERITLASVVAAALEACEPLARQQGDELAVVVPDEPVYLDADKTRLAQALSNLLVNAVKYSDRGSRIGLTARREGGEVVMSVKDPGVGIPAAMLPRVFDLFTQVDRSLEKSQGGLGVGLTIVKRLVEMHGGSVAAYSEGYGHGSEFVIRLPVAAASRPGPAAEAGTPEAPAPARHRILVADDNADAADSLAMMLTLMGHQVHTARDGLEAVAAATAFRPALILMDIGMPKLNGYDACRRIREQAGGRDAVLVALTGWGQDEDKRRSLEAGFDRHLVKPIEPAALERLVAELPPRPAVN